MRAMEALLQVDWNAATETWARIMVGDADDTKARVAAAFMRVSISPETLRAGIEALREVDVSPLLPLVRAPTLVLWRRQIPGWDVQRLARELASGIPDARLTMLEGTLSTPWDDMEPVLNAIDEFLEDSEPVPAGAEQHAASSVCTILFTDVEGSTALTERLGDAKAREVLRNHERITREALRAHGGAEVKAMGDGFMASFSSATRALECAIAMQRAFAAHDDEHPETPIRVRIGLNAGEPIAEDEDLFGTAVNMAARIAAQAQGGQILASDVVRQLVAGKGFLFSDHGEIPLKGFDQPMRLYEVHSQT
jgi:class 3 adenylate cyclase